MELLVVVSGFQLFKKSSSDLQFRNLQYELHKKLVGVGIMVAPLESDGTLNKEMSTLPLLRRPGSYLSLARLGRQKTNIS
jgi:hypothetical protein